MGPALFVGGVVLLVLLGAYPVVASDLFRKPYSPAWRTINRVLDRLNYLQSLRRRADALLPALAEPGRCRAGLFRGDFDDG